MLFRKAENKDFDSLVRLQNQNSILHDASLDQSDGALRSAFTAEDFAAINRDLGISVCVSNDDLLLGFACSSTPAFNQKLGLPAAMMARFDLATFDGKPINQWQSAIAGPVCVEKAARGTGVFEGLYEQLWKILPAEYELVLALVSTGNPRSIAAHKKIGMYEVDEFVYNGTTYKTVAKKIAGPRG